MDDDFPVGIACWNAGRLSEAADHFESLWVGEVGAHRECLRGLIHAAMGLHYATAGDVDAARSKLTTAARLLAPFPARFLGLDLDELRSGIRALCARLDAMHSTGGPVVGLGGAGLPRLRARPSDDREDGT